MTSLLGVESRYLVAHVMLMKVCVGVSVLKYTHPVYIRLIYNMLTCRFLTFGMDVGHVWSKHHRTLNNHSILQMKNRSQCLILGFYRYPK